MSLTRPVMVEAALSYARAGWRVLPCRATGARAKTPHVKGWPNNATTDPDTVRAWWHKWPNALIGVMVPDDVVVIDIDPRNGGSIQALEALAGGVLPPTLTAVSGGRDSGRHLYYKRPKGLDKSVIGCLPGIDVIVSGRFMIAPPSLHPDTGRPYQWENKTQPATMPTGLAQALTRTTASAPSVREGGRVRGVKQSNLSPHERIDRLSKTKPGQRNKALFNTACKAFEQGWSDEDMAALKRAALRTDLDVREVAKTIRSAHVTVAKNQGRAGVGDAR